VNKICECMWACVCVCNRNESTPSGKATKRVEREREREKEKSLLSSRVANNMNCSFRFREPLEELWSAPLWMCMCVYVCEYAKSTKKYERNKKKEIKIKQGQLRRVEWPTSRRVDSSRVESSKKTMPNNWRHRGKVGLVSSDSRSQRSKWHLCLLIKPQQQLRQQHLSHLSVYLSLAFALSGFAQRLKRPSSSSLLTLSLSSFTWSSSSSLYTSTTCRHSRCLYQAVDSRQSQVQTCADHWQSRRATLGLVRT